MDENKDKKKKRSLFRREITPERREELKQMSLKKRASLSLAYQLGYYVGEEIVHRFLPTLSVDGPQTRTNISVTCAEGDEFRRLNDVWYRNYDRNADNGINGEKNEDWKALRAYHEMLEEKYLPKTLECHFQLLNITEEHMAEFKKGVGDSLWNCDCSHYSTNSEDIAVEADEDGWFTNIILKRA
jgi:hypothetical protein